jgi:RNA polymerase sigma-70 factor, ECF subfamily
MIERHVAMNMAEQNIAVAEEKSSEQLINEIIHDYKDMVFNLLYRMTYNYDDAMELTQDTFLKAFQALPNFRYESSLKTWIYKIAFNVALNYKRKWKLFRKKESVEDTMLKDKDCGPEERASDNQLSEHIQHAINELPKDQKAMILLREIEELSYEEIAQILNLPLGTVKSRLARARCYLKQSLARYY